MSTDIASPVDKLAADADLYDRIPKQRRISSRELLGGQRVLVIQHNQEEYRLQVTRSGKLILTK
jgi:hemin uptake protein HemP